MAGMDRPHRRGLRLILAAWSGHPDLSGVEWKDDVLWSNGSLERRPAHGLGCWTRRLWIEREYGLPRVSRSDTEASRRGAARLRGLPGAASVRQGQGGV